MPMPATVTEIDEALTKIADGLRSGSHEYHEVALHYADSLLDQRLRVTHILEAWEKAGRETP